jgi:hypothetical protein
MEKMTAKITRNHQTLGKNNLKLTFKNISNKGLCTWTSVLFAGFAWRDMSDSHFWIVFGKHSPIWTPMPDFSLQT